MAVKKVAKETVAEPVAMSVPTPASNDTVAIPEKKKSNKTLLIVIGVLVFFFLVVPGVLIAAGGMFVKSKLGSDKATEKTLESIVSKATDSKVDINSKTGSVSVQGKDGSSLSVGSDQKLPADFPKSDVAFIEPKAITFALTSTTEGKKNWSMTTTVDKSFEAASAYFEQTIKEPAYTDVSTFASSETQTFTGKTAKYSVYNTVSKGQNGELTSVTYIVTEE